MAQNNESNIVNEEIVQADYTNKFNNVQYRAFLDGLHDTVGGSDVKPEIDEVVIIRDHYVTTWKVANNPEGTYLSATSLIHDVCMVTSATGFVVVKDGELRFGIADENAPKAGLPLDCTEEDFFSATLQHNFMDITYEHVVLAREIKSMFIDKYKTVKA